MGNAEYMGIIIFKELMGFRGFDGVLLGSCLMTLGGVVWLTKQSYK